MHQRAEKLGKLVPCISKTEENMHHPQTKLSSFQTGASIFDQTGPSEFSPDHPKLSRTIQATFHHPRTVRAHQKSHRFHSARGETFNPFRPPFCSAFWPHMLINSVHFHLLLFNQHFSSLTTVHCCFLHGTCNVHFVFLRSIMSQKKKPSAPSNNGGKNKNAPVTHCWNHDFDALLAETFTTDRLDKTVRHCVFNEHLSFFQQFSMLWMISLLWQLQLQLQLQLLRFPLTPLSLPSLPSTPSLLLRRHRFLCCFCCQCAFLFLFFFSLFLFLPLLCRSSRLSSSPALHFSSCPFP